MELNIHEKYLHIEGCTETTKICRKHGCSHCAYLRRAALEDYASKLEGLLTAAIMTTMEAPWLDQAKKILQQRRENRKTIAWYDACLRESINLFESKVNPENLRETDWLRRVVEGLKG